MGEHHSSTVTYKAGTEEQESETETLSEIKVEPKISNGKET